MSLATILKPISSDNKMVNYSIIKPELENISLYIPSTKLISKRRKSLYRFPCRYETRELYIKSNISISIYNRSSIYRVSNMYNYTIFGSGNLLDSLLKKVGIK